MLYGEDHRALMASVSRFCASEINPFTDAWERAGIFPAHALFAKMGKAGFLGINKPEAYGGQGLDYTYQIAFAEALGAAHIGAINLAVAVQTDMATPALARHGSESLKREFLAPAIAGEQVCCLGVSEPEAGSDISNIRTVARVDGDDYLITGAKMWITNGTQADWICLLCRTSDGGKLLNKSLVIVPLKAPGVTVARRLDKLGMNASDTAELLFEEVRVPQRHRIGMAGRGLLYQMEAFVEERLAISAGGLIGMERAIEDTIEQTRARRAFGRRVIDNQTVHFRLAELKTKIEALRSLVYRAAEEHAAERDATMLVCMAKLTAGRLQREVTDSCLQYFGAMGFMNETPISRQFRDGRLASIGGGTDEMMLTMISRLMGTLPLGAQDGTA